MPEHRKHYAHTREGRPASDWQLLWEHLQATASHAADFATPFGAASWARDAGKWHDVGKYSDAFQEYLRAAGGDPHVAETTGKVDHSTAGAQHAASGDVTVGKVNLGHLLAFVIAGHHGGLPDGRSDTTCLEHRLKKLVEPWDHAPTDILAPGPLTDELPPPLRNALANRDAFGVAFFTRMLFSCLVDADFLDTEAFMKPEKARMRPAWPTDILRGMSEALDRWVADLDAPSTPVNRQRVAVREACLAAADKEPGLFSLTVPTGGGKTLSSLAFALRHATRHELSRVVYVVPFTTIIEQNADVFRDVMSSLIEQGITDPIVEHHSNLDINDAAGGQTAGSRLATENWEAPLIVTTSVQFYESLFANRTSRCRKLHNLARSVIVLDEVQTLPVDYLEPCLRVLEQLVDNYSASVVLCTATQPAVERRDDFEIGLEGAREIVPDPGRLYEELRRVEVSDLGDVPDTEIVSRLRRHEQVLCIVNTRGHARALFEALGSDESHFHLSALMCPTHRTERIARIHRRLEDRLPCRVVSTQLIEAGVDIDFPVVYRSLAGLDSIAQAAGRCNRNGTAKRGPTYVFRSEHVRAEQYFADTTNSAVAVLPLYSDILSLEAINHYFRLYYWEQNARWDRKKILEEFRLDNDPTLPFLFGFATASRNFRLIEDTGKPVIIPWGDEGERLCNDLRKWPTRAVLRQLQRYTVQISRWVWEKHAPQLIELVDDRYPVLSSPSHYDHSLGLCFDRNLDTLIV